MRAKIIICSCMAFLLFTFSSPAKAERSATDGIYLSAKILASSQTNWSKLSLTNNANETFGIDEAWSQMLLGLALGIGYDFYPYHDVPIRLDLEYSMRNMWSGNSTIEASDGFRPILVDYEASMNMRTLMLNAYYDFYNSSIFTPYVTAGFGLAFLDINLNTGQNSSGTNYAATLTSPAWQIGAGVGVEITPNVSLDIGYKFLSFSNSDFATSDLLPPALGTTNTNIRNIGTAHEVALGLRYTFGGSDSDEEDTKTTSSFDSSTGIYVSGKFLGSMQKTWSHGSVTELADTSYFSNDDSQLTTGVAIALGYDFYPRFDTPVRLDLEYTMRLKTKEESYYSLPSIGGDIKTHMNLNTLMLNAYYDFYNSSRFTPYLTAGLGIAFINSNTFYETLSTMGIFQATNTTNFAWQIGTGVGIELTKNIALDIGYKFLHYGYFNHDTENIFSFSSADYKNSNIGTVGTAHEVALGLRYTF